MAGSGWRAALFVGMICALAAIERAAAEGAVSKKTREAELRRAIALAQHGKLGICNTVADCPVWNKGGSCRNGRCTCPAGKGGLFCIKSISPRKPALQNKEPTEAPHLPAGTHVCVHKVRLCHSNSDCNAAECPHCSCNPCGQCTCANPFRGAFCEERTHAPTPAPTPKCRSIKRVCHADKDCNNAQCKGCTCTACGRCACSTDWSGPRCGTKTRQWYARVDRASGTPFCSTHSDCNGHECPNCKCLVTGKCACALGFSGTFCTDHERAKDAVPIWKRSCQVAQDCNWPRCASCSCGKDFTCRCSPGFHGDNCDNKKYHGVETGSLTGAASIAGGGHRPTDAPTAPPAPSPAPGPTTTPWPTPIVQCFSEGDCNYPVCATCSCFHGGCRCTEGWTGIFCTERATKAPTKKVAPTPMPSLPNLVAGPDQLPCYITRDCSMAKGAKCYRGVCMCPKGTSGLTCESNAKPTPKPTPQPTPFDLKDLKVPKGQLPCFSPGDCNWHVGGRCVNHLCQCPPGWSGMGCMHGPTPAPKRVGLDTTSFQSPPSVTPWPTPVLGCRTVGDCNAARCKTCECYHGGCLCKEGWHGSWCQLHATKAPTPKKAPRPGSLSPSPTDADGNAGLAGVLKKVMTLKDKVAAMFNKSPGTMSPAALQKAKEDSKANRYFDRAFGYDDSASAGSAKGDTAYYAQRFWPGSTEVHDAIVNSKKFWPDDSYFAGHNHRPT